MGAFVLSKEAARCTSRTVEHSTYTIGAFLGHLECIGVTLPRQITSHHMRCFLVERQHKGLKHTTQHAHARGIKTWLRWLTAEGDACRNSGSEPKNLCRTQANASHRHCEKAEQQWSPIRSGAQEGLDAQT
jgi:site-specific recombinase XerD